VFLAFLLLGLTSFGGPVAHLGYFRSVFVERRGWLDEAAYADLVALCQFLPGPASSQVGFCLGMTRAGLLGGLAAWCGFTLPSAALMLAFAALQPTLFATPLGEATVRGLKLAAVAVVAQALLGMARSLAPDARRAAIAVLALAVVVAAGPAVGQLAAIAVGAGLGLLVCRSTERPATVLPARAPALWPALVLLALFAILFAPGAPGLGGGARLTLFHAFYRSGALVFGGGHVVLPLLRAEVVTPGWVSDNAFLAGYGAAQALPGPLFTIAAYLGAVSRLGGGLAGGAVALAAIFLPGLLLVAAVQPHWSRLRAMAWAQAAMRGAGAAVVGILALAFYDPVWSGGVRDPVDLAVAGAAVVMLTAWRGPPLLAVGLCVAAGVARALLTV
jgi:chromate transporter